MKNRIDGWRNTFIVDKNISVTGNMEGTFLFITWKNNLQPMIDSMDISRDRK